METNFNSFRGGNVQKTVKKSLAIIASIVLISFTVNAQDFWRSILENETLNEIAGTMVDGRSSFKSGVHGSATNVNGYKVHMLNEKEESLKLEDWMKDEHRFETLKVNSNTDLNTKNYAKTASYFTTPEPEQKLELEPWMMDENNFNTGEKIVNADETNNFILQDEKDKKLELEDWMVNNDYWK